MRSLSTLLRCSRRITSLPIDGGQCLRAREVEFRQNVSCISYVHCGDAMNQNGDAAAFAAAKEATTAADDTRRWIHSSLDFGSVIDSTTLKPRVRREASDVADKYAEPPSAHNCDFGKCGSDSGTREMNSIRSMLGEGCEESSGIGELQNTPNGSVITEGINLRLELDSGSGVGNENQKFRGLRDEGLISATRSLEVDTSMRECRSGHSCVDDRNRISNGSELRKDRQVLDPVVRFASGNSKPDSVADATEANIQSEVSKLLVVTPISVPEEGGPVGHASEYPVPLTPFSGEKERVIEYQRAMVAETAMKSGPAISRNDILFEDEWLMAINKPCGIYSEHVLATIPSLLQTSASLAPESLPKDENVSREETHLHMANRLDRDTSGVMVITKCKRAAGKMSRIFTSRWVEKSYLALCAATPPAWKNLTVDSGHGRSRFGAWRVYSKKDVGRGLPGKCVVRNMTTHFMVAALNEVFVAKQMDSGDIPKGRSSWEDPKAGNVVTAGEEHSNKVLRPSGLQSSTDTHNEGSLGRDSLSDNGDEVLIRAFPFTGRTHQIRLHCQYIGMPLVGDVKYGGPHMWNGVQYDHHALHAETLSFRHPFTSEKLFLVAPLPQWARDAGVQTLHA